MTQAELTAELTVEPLRTAHREELVARARLQNQGDDPLEIDLAPLGSPSLAIEIVDRVGAPVHLPPPPVPSNKSQVATLAAHECRSVEYAGFLPSWIPPGVYRARLRYVGFVAEPKKSGRSVQVASDWAEFVVSADDD